MFSVIFFVLAVLLSSSIATVNARDVEPASQVLASQVLASQVLASQVLASQVLAAAPTAKQQCINTCRIRYRDCRRLNQLPASECRGIYQDCTRYTCTGLGPG